MYISVRGINCASVSVILGLSFGTVLTLWYFVFHFITAFVYWKLTINLKKNGTTCGAESVNTSGLHY